MIHSEEHKQREERAEAVADGIGDEVEANGTSPAIQEAKKGRVAVAQRECRDSEESEKAESAAVSWPYLLPSVAVDDAEDEALDKPKA
ncbi:hypothetical protein SLS58_002832, partial [Diplodia intermedia]